MKLKNYLLLSGIVLFAAACSNNDDENNQEMTLERVEEYYPSKAGYENPAPPYEHMASKEVQYYENGEIVIDSVFHNDSGFRRYRKTVEKKDNLIVKRYYDDSDIITLTATYHYDDSGKLLKIYNESSNPFLSNYSYEYTYSQDGNITCTYTDSSGNEYPTTCTTNETGQISGIITNSQDGPYTTTFIYEDGDLIQITTNNNSGINNYSLGYYDVVKPSNLQMNITQFNNTILENGVEKIGEYSKRYIKSNDVFSTYESSFNGSGYITHSIYTDLTGGASGPPEKYEAFYYYN
jgi:hypothetical protein